MAVTIVVGPPCAGKSTYVQENRREGDLVVDYDAIAQTLGSDTPHDATGVVQKTAFVARQAAIRAALAMDSDDSQAWIIHTRPQPEQVQTYVDAGAEFVAINPGKDTCLARATGRPDGVKNAIESWFSDPPELPESVQRRAAVSDEQAPPKAPIEIRDTASVAGVNFAQRVIEIVAMPYEETATVEYRGELWQETFERGAFDGIEKRPNRVRANRDHDKSRTVGKVVNFWPSREEGLVAEVRVSKTALGDETLALADDEVLGASVGFAVRGRDQVLERRSMTRRIKRAFMDHLAFTPDPAYVGAMPLSVRSGVEAVNAADLPKLVTPNLDELLNWQRAHSRERAS